MFNYAKPHETYLSIKINNWKLNDEHLRRVINVEVDETDTEAKLCRITIQDADFKFLNNKYIISEGLPVEVSMGYTDDFEQVFKGFITHVEPSFDETYVPSVVIGATDTASLMFKEFTREFKKIKRSDLVIKIAKEMGYKAVVQSTTEVVDNIKQDAESNPKLLARLADDEGYVCSIVTANKTIYFHSRMQKFGKTPTVIEYGFGNYMLKKLSAQTIYKNKNVTVESTRTGTDGTAKTSTAKTGSTKNASSTQAPTSTKLTVDGVTGNSRIVKEE